MFDLLIKGGTLIDSSRGIRGTYDLAVTGAYIAQIASAIPVGEAKRVINATGYTVTPGLIDLHTHVYDGFTRLGVDPDLVGVYAGVTTLADAGTSGSHTFSGFPKYVLPNAQTEIFVFLNIGRTGLATSPEITDAKDIDLDSTIKVASENVPVVKGIKARMVSPALDNMGMEMPRMALKAARDTGGKFMVHIGQRGATYDPAYVSELLPLLAAGDIVTHIYCVGHGGVLDQNGELLPQAKEAYERGVWMDVGFGQGHFGFETAKRIMDQGIIPHSISSDITTPGRVRTVHSLVEMMTRFLALGFSLGEVVTMATTNPAKALGEEHRLGSLAIGRQADISVLYIKDGSWTVYDTEGGSLLAKRAVLPVLTIKRGQVFQPEWGPRPWGWEPDPSVPPGL